jgi:hypothetical protein
MPNCGTRFRWLALAVLVGGCAPYDAGDKPYTVDDYRTPPEAIYDHAGNRVILPHPVHCLPCL